MRIKVPIWEILNILIPIIRDFASQIKVAKEAESDGGPKITKTEWQDMVLELLVLRACPAIVDALMQANTHVVDED